MKELMLIVIAFCWGLLGYVAGYHSAKEQMANVPPPKPEVVQVWADCSPWININRHLVERLGACYACCADVQESGRKGGKK